jgi:Tfp pilus assembly protein FimV
VCTVLILALVAAVSVLLAPPTQAAPPAARPRAIVVHPGDTLWSIATAALPDESPVDAMVAIERLNHMPDATVYVGQQILLPPA